MIFRWLCGTQSATMTLALRDAERYHDFGSAGTQSATMTVDLRDE